MENLILPSALHWKWNLEVSLLLHLKENTPCLNKNAVRLLWP